MSAVGEPAVTVPRPTRLPLLPLTVVRLVLIQMARPKVAAHRPVAVLLTGGLLPPRHLQICVVPAQRVQYPVPDRGPGVV